MGTGTPKPTGKSLLPAQDSHTEREWQKKFFAMGAKCYYCKSKLFFAEATKDHKTPTCRGGANRISNIVPSCLACNQSKGWRTESEFMALHPEFSTNPQPRLGKTLKPTPDGVDAAIADLSLRERDEPPLKSLRREAEGGCPLAFKAGSL